MSPRDSEDMRRDFEAAQERDLHPLLDDSIETLELGPGQRETMETFLLEAWASGTRAGRDQMEARTKPEPDVKGAAISNLETDFKALMDESAEALNLTMSRTIRMWNYLHEAWMAGNRTCEAELMALYIEVKSADVGDEALEWLRGQGGTEGGPPSGD